MLPDYRLGGERMLPLGVKLPASTLAALRDTAQQLHIPRAALARHALITGLQQLQQLQQQEVAA